MAVQMLAKSRDGGVKNGLMDIVLGIASAVVGVAALALSVVVYVRQQRATRIADVSVWFEAHEGERTRTYVVIKNNGPGPARDIVAKFYGPDGDEWEPRWVSDGDQFPLFPVEALSAGDWLERYYAHVIGTPMPVMMHLNWRDGRRGVQLKETWTGLRHARA